MKYVYPKGDFISGFGENSSYEKECQAMVIRGMEWLDEHPEVVPKFSQYKNIYGIVNEENEDAKGLTQVIIGEKSKDITGAMHQAAVNHCLYATKNGWEKYIKELTKPILGR